MSKQASVSSNIKRWRVEKLKRCKTNGVNRVSAQINDEMVWFESADAPLTPNPEAFATAFLLPALEQGAELVMEDPVSGVWLDNIEQLLPIWNKWWRYPLKNPIVCQRSDGAAKTPPAATLTGACFTGGVDSFYTLLRSRHSIDALVFVHGYDIPLEDSKRMAAFEPGMRGVAETLNKKSIIVRSNLRRHHCFSGTNWERSHGAALAATAHALRSNFGRLIIPTTLTYDRTHGWGSHWMTDSLWSSESLEIVHDDATWRRSEKIMMMAHKPILWNNLRVCWENRRPEGNCSSCENACEP